MASSSGPSGFFNESSFRFLQVPSRNVWLWILGLTLLLVSPGCCSSERVLAGSQHLGTEARNGPQGSGQDQTALSSLQAKAPYYTFESMTINKFLVRKGHDSRGVPTNLLDMDVLVHWFAKNKSPTFSAYFNGGVAQAGFGSTRTVSLRRFSQHFWMRPGEEKNFSSHFTAKGFPLYKVGPVLVKEIEGRYVKLSIGPKLVTLIPEHRKQPPSKFTSSLLCTVSLDPYTLMFINGTCSAA